MTEDATESLIRKILLMILTAGATHFHLQGDTITAIGTDLADATVLAWSIYAHWGMVKTPAVIQPGPVSET